ncbi:MAG: uroporphyrinogen-III synthase [Alphaproteobacteria bacterium]
MDKQTILITRPQDDAELFAKALAEHAITSLIQPMLDIRYIPFDPPDLDTFEGLIFTSANGVKAFAARALPQTIKTDITVYTVGGNTAQAARDAGFNDVITAGGNAASLIEILPPADGKLLHLHGRHITPAFRPPRDLTIEELIIYEAKQRRTLSETTRAALQNNGLHAITFFSKRTAEAFIHAAEAAGFDPSQTGIKALCISESVLNYVRKKNWQNAYSADTPDQNGMTQLVCRHCRKTEQF